jgi:hypothetical protein
MPLEDVLTGAVTGGVNPSTFIVLNALLLAAVLSLAGLLAVSLHSAPALAPHAAFLLFLALVLWGLIFWFVSSVVGFADPEKQRGELLAGGAEGGGAGGGSPGGTDHRAVIQEAKKAQ